VAKPLSHYDLAGQCASLQRSHPASAVPSCGPLR